VKQRSSLSMVSRSNRSVLYSMTPDSPARPSGVSAKSMLNSSFAVPVAIGTVRSSRPCAVSTPPGVFCTESITCASAGRLRSRSGISSSTRRSNGTS